ncbi:tetraacyldisaccharide 4'-kinase [Leptospira fluminis]|uniref:Tetraacyldisaccharide 4'-kinase n=1 Tax=Leptospira fluminis TaxID=2484979 RepID=A0A4R9GSR0_9LEPT|nr:tetraacyldisaccharide 4'-kinase [Leptospira fluminis]TGK20835.1 tetraacyldisaccharide 4'-kinase [Leptospira fluminis]
MLLRFVRILFFPLLYLLSLLYRILFLCDKARKAPRKLPHAFVISVGNFSVGGTGKTPFTLHLAELLHGKFPKIPIVILSRGYGGSVPEGTARVRIDSPAKEVGDEPLLLKKNLPFAEVYVGKDRYESYSRFRRDSRISETQIVFAILDDGFQHHSLSRNLEIVLLDCTRIGKDRFQIPAGRLREPYTSVSRADFLIASKYEDRFGKELEKWKKSFRPKTVLEFRFVPTDICLTGTHLETVKIPVEALNGKKILAFSGIGNPEPFYLSLKEAGAQCTLLRFPDHHSYTRSDLQELSHAAEGKEFIVCTEKDWVKLSPLLEGSSDHRWAYLEIKTSLQNESVLLDRIDEFVKRNIP